MRSVREPIAMAQNQNLDHQTVKSFGKEWHRFDQSGMSEADLAKRFDEYFCIFPWGQLAADSVGFDLGCGSGRWATLVAPRVGTLHCIDPSADALAVARRNLADQPNCEFHCESANALSMADASQDFGYSIGVLHHIPDPLNAMRCAVQKLKPGAPFLVYLYYAFDNRPKWYALVWRLSDIARRIISKCPDGLKFAISSLLAAFVYYPLTRIASALERLGVDVSNFPLSYYRQYGYYNMRTDALDRFGTRLEHRFTRVQIKSMMQESGLADIRFSEGAPFWVAVGTRR